MLFCWCQISHGWLCWYHCWLMMMPWLCCTLFWCDLCWALILGYPLLLLCHIVCIALPVRYSILWSVRPFPRAVIWLVPLEIPYVQSLTYIHWLFISFRYPVLMATAILFRQYWNAWPFDRLMTDYWNGHFESIVFMTVILRTLTHLLLFIRHLISLMYCHFHLYVVLFILTMTFFILFLSLIYCCYFVFVYCNPVWLTVSY